ncbi:hypothetical protein AgCh_019312 [Apium graveolens]
MDYQEGEHVLLKISPWKGLTRFSNKGKLKTRYVGPFEILKRVGKLAYELALPPHMQHIHNVFHVSMLKQYNPDSRHVIEYEPIDIQPDLSFVEQPESFDCFDDLYSFVLSLGMILSIQLIGITPGGSPESGEEPPETGDFPETGRVLPDPIKIYPASVDVAKKSDAKSQALKTAKAVKSGTTTFKKVKKIRTTVTFHRPMTLTMDRNPKYPRISATPRNVVSGFIAEWKKETTEKKVLEGNAWVILPSSALPQYPSVLVSPTVPPTWLPTLPLPSIPLPSLSLPSFPLPSFPLPSLLSMTKIVESSVASPSPTIVMEEISKNLLKIDSKIRSTISVVHLGAIQILLKAEFQEGIDSPIKMALIDNRINNRRDCILGAARGDKVFSLTYVVAYALTNSHHSIDYKKNEYIELDDVFSEIGSVEEKQFSDISPLDNSWAIDIARNKPILGQKPRMSFRGRTLEVGESSNTSNKELLHSMSRRVDDLCQKLDHL